LADGVPSARLAKPIGSVSKPVCRLGVEPEARGPFLV